MVVIIGAGISGLTCGAYLKKNGIDFTIYEKSSHPGGRVHTEANDGYLYDLGFQVFNPMYPEVKRLLSTWKLGLKRFNSGAKVFNGEKFVSIDDPRKSPGTIFKTLRPEIGTFRDRMKLYKLSKECKKMDIENLQSANQSTHDFLHGYGFSDEILDLFLFPFVRGIFLEKKLNTDASFFKFVFRMFNDGYATLPKGGMKSVPEHLEKMVGKKNIQYNYEVSKIKKDKIVFTNGAQVPADKIVLACDPEVTSEFLGQVNKVGKKSTNTYYFNSPKSFDKYLYLIPDSDKINHVAFLSDVQRKYSKSGTLVSVSSIGASSFKGATILDECKKYFGDDCKDWTFLKSFKISYALPAKFSYGSEGDQVKNIYFIGDYTQDPSVNGAMKSGRLLAEKLSR